MNQGSSGSPMSGITTEHGRDGAVPMRPGFGKRLAAAWVDGFVIYVVASFVITLGSSTGARIAFEPLFVVVGAAYGTALLASRGQTVGKMLVGITVETKGASGRPSTCARIS